MPRLHNKSALVTGAAQGIGLAIAQAFLREGARVVLTDINDELGVREAGKLGPNAVYAHLDVAQDSDWSRVVGEHFTAQSPLDILVNNAGITGFDPAAPEPQDPEHASLDAWNRVHATNLTGTFLGCKHAIRAMRQSPAASIINMSSRSGIVGVPRASAYASSKAAISNHTKSVALYCAEERLNIRCNAILPAAILTPMWEPMLAQGEDRQASIDAIVKGTPLNRFGTPQEVASLAVYLASDESAYTTGSDFTLDGGLLAGTATPPPPKD